MSIFEKRISSKRRHCESRDLTARILSIVLIDSYSAYSNGLLFAEKPLVDGEANSQKDHLCGTKA